MNDFVKHDGSKNPLHLLPTVALERIGEVLDAGQKKYAPNNWRKIDKRSRYYSAALRHLFAWNRGEDKDPETSLKHLAHAACSLLFLLEAEELGLGEDDRPMSKKTPIAMDPSVAEEFAEDESRWKQEPEKNFKYFNSTSEQYRIFCNGEIVARVCRLPDDNYMGEVNILGGEMVDRMIGKDEKDAKEAACRAAKTYLEKIGKIL